MKVSLILAVLMFTLPVSWARSPVLERVKERVAAAQQAGKVPVVVMDLDETVVDTSARKLMAYQDAVQILCGVNRQGDCGRVAGINLSEVYLLDNRYNLTPLFRSLGVQNLEWIKRLTDTAIEIYLSDKWMALDQSVPGSTEYVQELRGTGAEIFYVSSRWQSKQGEATRISLQRLGLSSEQKTGFTLLRPDGMSSIDFKVTSFEKIKKWTADHPGVVLGAFENEPENMNALVAQFADAEHVFVDGAILHDVPLLSEVSHIVSYR